MARNVKDTETTTDNDKAPEATEPEAQAQKAEAQGETTPEATSDKGEASEGDKAASSLDHASKPRELTLQQFLRVSGTRPDQAAGFMRHAQRVLPGRHPLDTWKSAMSDFWNMPAR